MFNLPQQLALRKPLHRRPLVFEGLVISLCFVGFCLTSPWDLAPFAQRAAGVGSLAKQAGGSGNYFYDQSNWDQEMPRGVRDRSTSHVRAQVRCHLAHQLRLARVSAFANHGGMEV